MKTKTNLAILASGNGSNFEAIIKAVKKGYLSIGKCILITDKKDAYVRERAKKYKIKEIFVDPASFKNKKEYEKKLVEIHDKEKIDLIALAGYMKILSPFFVKYFKNKILNIHPSLLPSFSGKDAIENAYNYGCKITGVTVHFVSNAVDSGPIIMQKTVSIEEGMQLDELENKIHKTEHKLYPKAIRLFLKNKLKIEGRRVKII
ncbi:MAG: phosphoribosylglycinamide formyltransferase [Candidatus Omnitrophica bacterium]|nr:phosphoribosylglycinamide formyltransferase [Candidatus Omnitrophota bacterium]MCF7891433.1 phosphoribosylglycinamide formyltransferase [Candidatus Omnitrophota bacterium]MCF7898094.1 phosphoribosylglycinamide formyltransferase [Candidatus Omnitrophota bacterium]